MKETNKNFIPHILSVIWKLLQIYFNVVSFYPPLRLLLCRQISLFKMIGLTKLVIFVVFMIMIVSIVPVCKLKRQTLHITLL